MALRLRLPLLVVIVVSSAALPRLQPSALAAGLDEKGKAVLKQATRFFKQGMYDEAAKMLTELVVDHPEMASLQRNLGACYYYMRQPAPALSNLRAYLLQKNNDIGPEDKAEVDRWIEEMEKLRKDGAGAVVAAPATGEKRLS
jgi:DNA-binding SARP family transcriptional activator